MLKRRRNRTVAPPGECALTACMRYLSGAWTANILWYLSDHPRRFSELKYDLNGVSAKVLSQRLRRLCADGLVRRTNIDTSPPSVEYSLTELGGSLRPALSELVRIGEQIKRRRQARTNVVSYEAA